MENQRRNFLRKTFIGASGVLALGQAQAKALEICQRIITPTQAEGPFYPIRDQQDKDWDLTWVKGRGQRAKGEIVTLNGFVQDTNCMPVKGALVEIWQACHSGKYNHPSDPNSEELDPNFQYWGRSVTDQEGKFIFKTIKPGSYPAGQGWVRPPHIHMKVHLRGHEEVTTQLYFKDEKILNSKDYILQRLSSSERESVIVDYKENKNIEGKSGDVVITLKRFL